MLHNVHLYLKLNWKRKGESTLMNFMARLCDTEQQNCGYYECLSDRDFLSGQQEKGNRQDQDGVFEERKCSENYDSLI